MSGLRLTNTYSRSVEPFIPADSEGKSVLMYTCGPTVYSYAHIGNFRTFLFSDLLRRVLERSGYTVRQVMNITDVGHLTEDDMADASGEDKLVEAARKMGWDPYRVADHFREAFEADARTLRLRIYSPEEAAQDDLHPKATRHIPEMLAMLDTLIEKGHAYTDSTGQVYFSIESFPEYGKLSNKVIDDLESGSRVSVRAEKRDPRDFALWKVDGTHLMQWDPHSAEGWPAEDWERLQRMLPNGVRPEIKKGFPGWHIECSAMSLACLAETIDIHTGGEDNIFPHHECEIAQSCCALDVSVPGPSPDDEPRRSFAKYWVHSRHLLVDGRKMSKRDGTFFTVRNLLDPEGSDRADLVPRLKAVGFDEGKVTGEDLRLALLWGRYSQPMNFSLDLLARAHKARLRMQTLYERTTEVAAEGDAAEAIVTASTKALADFDEALQDDLNVDRAMAILFEYVAQMNQAETGPAEAAQIQTALESFDQVLEILIRRRTGVVSAADLDLWCTPEHRVARAEALSVWRDDPGRVDLYTALNAGEVPAVDAFAQLGTDLSDAEVEALVGLRYAARKAKNWGVADAIRDHVKVAGISIEDSPDGARWKIA